MAQPARCSNNQTLCNMTTKILSSAVHAITSPHNYNMLIPLYDSHCFIRGIMSRLWRLVRSARKHTQTPRSQIRETSRNSSDTHASKCNILRLASIAIGGAAALFCSNSNADGLHIVKTAHASITSDDLPTSEEMEAKLKDEYGIFQ